MSSIDLTRLARAHHLIAEGHALLAEAYDAASDQPAPAGEPLSVPAPAGSVAGAVPPAPAAYYDPTLSSADVARSQQEQHVNSILGECPDHQRPWEVKPGGVSTRTNKTFTAFWRCNQMVGDAFCKKRPVKAWLDSHPIQEAA